MDNYKSIETKLWNAISVLTSGVLTSLIYEAISESSYVLEIEGKQYVFTSTGIGFWGALGIILVVFLFLWAVISKLIPLLLRLKRRFSYDKIKRINVKELIKTIDNVKESITILYPILCAENKAEFDLVFARLHNRQLAKTILLLHRKFLPSNKKMRKTIKGYFRNADHSSVITIDKKISSYEFLSIIVLLREMVKSIKETDCTDELLEKDCIEMEKALDELDKLIDRGE